MTTNAATAVLAVVAIIWIIGALVQIARALHTYAYKRSLLDYAVAGRKQQGLSYGRSGFTELYVASERKVIGNGLTRDIAEALMWPVAVAARTGSGTGITWWSVLGWSGVRAARRDQKNKIELHDQYRALTDLRNTTDDPSTRAILSEAARSAYTAYITAPGPMVYADKEDDR